MAAAVGRHEAARKHLNIIRGKEVVPVNEAARFVQLAFTYGLSVQEISYESGFPVRLVQRLLTGGN